MGNCINPTDPLVASIPKEINVDCTPIKQSKLPIIFVIGGPGAGKRTLCNKVAEKYGFNQLITSDILRHEVAKRSERAFAIARLMSEGHLVPSNILVELIALRMLDHLGDKKGFIISGFPRKKGQAKLFNEEVRPPDLVLFLNVRNSVMNDRMMAKSIKATERLSINNEAIKSQIKEFYKRNKPILKYYKRLLAVIDAEYDVITVFNSACEVIDQVLAKLPSFQLGIATTSAPANTKNEIGY